MPFKKYSKPLSIKRIKIVIPETIITMQLEGSANS